MCSYIKIKSNSRTQKGTVTKFYILQLSCGLTNKGKAIFALKMKKSFIPLTFAIYGSRLKASGILNYVILETGNFVPLQE